jgi:hypothetical protein
MGFLTWLAVSERQSTMEQVRQSALDILVVYSALAASL